MVRVVDIQVDVTSALGLGKQAQIAATVTLPEPQRLEERPVVFFGKPGGGYSRLYYTHDLPGPGQAAQARFHVERGGIFVASDILGSGESSGHDPQELSFVNLALAAHHAEQEILLRLANGVLAPDYPPVINAVSVGVGHATGASIALTQQARYGSFDGLALLGFSGFHNHPPTRPGDPPLVTPWFARGASPTQPDSLINAAALANASQELPRGSEWATLAWSFYFEDVPADVVERDLGHYDIVSGALVRARQNVSPWHSVTAPRDVASSIFTPGAMAAEAAAVTVPVLSAIGERDIVVDPLGEARAFRSAPSFDLFVCPRMGHMHNFAGTRAILWARLHQFGAWARAWRERPCQ